ncbi:hypothetical protein DXG01_009735 [Tephrocybe rancida]|nr:hypothetical protein DXG01_009735 [Tephrocybe rancida]
MFSVKATYNGEIRRFSFPESTTFPTFEQLYAQLNRVFPSSNKYYLSKLLFFPDATKPGRILIGSQVHNAEDYNKCILAFRGRSWPNASLRFSLIDGSSGLGQGRFLSQTVGQFPWTKDSGAPFSAGDTASKATPNPGLLFPPRPPVTFVMPPRALAEPTGEEMLVDVSNDAYSVGSSSAFSFETARPQEANGVTSSCCSTAQVKKDVENLLKTFQRDLDRAVAQLSGSNTPIASVNVMPSSQLGSTPPHPPTDCSSCGKPPAGLWFACDDCFAVVCSRCNIFDMANLCTESGGRHTLRLVSQATGPSNYPIGHEFAWPRVTHPPPTITPSVSPNSSSNNYFIPPLPPFSSSSLTGANPTSVLSPPAIHRRICVDCPDFDLCTPITEEQHPYHSFVKISKEEDFITRERAPSPHHFARCDACSKFIEGVRYKCMHRDCPDFDLCERCEALPIPQHPDTHPLLKMRSAETVIPTVYRSPEFLQQDEVSASSFLGGINQPMFQEPSVASRSHVVVAEPGSESMPSSYDIQTEYGGLTLTSPEHATTSTNLPGLFSHCVYPMPLHSPQWPSLMEPASQLHDDSPSTNEHPELSLPGQLTGLNFGSDVEVLSPLNTTSPAILDAIDAPAVPGAWHSAGLSNIINSPPEQLVPFQPPTRKDDSVYSHEEATATDSPLHTEAILIRPASPDLPEMRQVFPSSNRSLADLLNGYNSMSNLKIEDVEIQEELSDIASTPLSAGFIEDITAPDGQIFTAGVTFIKVWRMVNNSARDWPSNTQVVFVGGTQLVSGNPPPHIQPMCTVGPLKPGEEKNVWTPELKAPDTPGRYTSYWRLQDDKGELFGDNIWVEIEVVNPSTPSSHREESLSSSSVIIMPDPTSPPSPGAIERAISRSPTVDTEDDSDDYLSDSSSVSIVSMPSSEDDADITLWAESRAQGRNTPVEDRAQTTAAHVAEHSSQAMDYVLLYDDNTSEEE